MLSMKIVINGRFLTQKITGVQRYAIELVKTIDRLIGEPENIRNGFEFTILVPSCYLSNELKLQNIEIKKVGLLSGHMWEQFELPFYAKGDVVFFPCNTASILSLFFSKSVVVTVHDLSFKYFPDAYSKSFRFFYNFLMPLIFRFSKKIITVSNSEKAMIRQVFSRFDDKVVSIYHGISNEFFNRSELDVKNNRPYILYVGSLSDRKNFNGVLESFEIVSRSFECDLFVIGLGGKTFSKNNITSGLSDNNVNYIGHVSDLEVLKSYYQNASCFVFPSHYESFGFPVLEAMASCCPVVTSKTSCLPEIAGDAAILCNPTDSNDVALSILRVLNDNVLSRQLKVDGLQRAKKFNWRCCAKATLDEFHKLS